MSQITASTLLPLLTVAAGVTSAAFGLLGVATESRRGDRLTAFGWVAMVGIIISTSLALSIEQIKHRLDIKGENKRRIEESTRFKSQIARLGLIAAELNENLASVKEVRLEQGRSTDKVMGSLWSDANRVGTSSIQVITLLTCHGLSTPRLPDFFGPNAIAEIRLESRRAFIKSRKDGQLLDPNGVLDDPIDLELAAPRSYQTHSDTERDADGRTVYDVYRVMIFDETMTDLHGFDNIRNWDNKAVEVIVQSDNRVKQQTIDTTFSSHLDISPPEAVFHIKPSTRSDMQILPCDADLALSVNGRNIAKAYGLAFRIAASTDDKDMMYVKYPIVDIDNSKIPSFFDKRD